MKNEWRFISILPTHERQFFLYLMCAIAFSIPFQASYNSILLSVLLLFWLLFMPKQFDAQRLKVIGLVSVVFWLALIGLTYTKNIDEGLFRIQQKAILLVFPLVLGTIRLDWRQLLKQLFSVFVITAVIACFVCLLDAIFFWIQTNNIERFFFENLLHGGWLDLYPYILAYLCLTACIILAESLLGNLQLSNWLMNRAVSISLLFFLTVFILLLSVKMVIIIMVGLILTYALRLNKKIGSLLALSCITVLTIAFFSLPTLRARIQEALAEEGKQNALNEQPELGTPLNGVALRRALWVCSLDVIKNNPTVGVGTGDGQDELQAAYENRKFILASRYNRFNAHNQYLQTLINFGTVGLIVWLLSLGWLFVAFKSNRLLFVILGVLLFAMLTESMLETNKGCLLMAFLVSVCCFGFQSNSLAKEV
jgi:O-antigen ligase